jgi:hypothetical protein
LLRGDPLEIYEIKYTVIKEYSFIYKAYFLGATPQLKNMDMITNPSDRFRLETITMGKVYLELSILTRNFEANGVVL